jgi:uracil-DNA glycosylase
MNITKVKNNAFQQSFVVPFDTWYEPLYDIIKTLYFKDLILTINDLYNNWSKEPVYPNKINVLKVFRECDWNNLKVVILGQDPYPNWRANGLAFANVEVASPSPSLKAIWEAVECDVHNGLQIDFDVTLNSWSKQGVMLLNAALTTNRLSGSHTKIWKPFTEEVLRTISDKKEGIIFMLWGKVSQSYEEFIDTNKHIVLKEVHPAFSKRLGIPWPCTHFSQVNEILKKQGKSKIDW